MRRAQFAAVVLAGGRSTRMGGVDKAAMEIDGVAMLTTVLAAAGENGAAPIIVMGAPRLDLVPPVAQGAVRFLTDPVDGGGPAAALAAGVAALGEPPLPTLLLLAADLPFITADALSDLAATLHAAESDVDGVLPQDRQGRLQWLCSAWRTATLRHAIAAHDKTTGASLHRLFAPLCTQLWKPHGITAGREPWQDCDTLDDLEHARHRPN